MPMVSDLFQEFLKQMPNYVTYLANGNTSASPINLFAFL